MRYLTLLLILFLFSCGGGITTQKEQGIYEVMKIKPIHFQVDGVPTDYCIYTLVFTNGSIEKHHSKVLLYRPCNQYDIGDKLFFVPIEVTD